VPVAPDFVNGKIGITTGPAALGCPFMAGTAEGRATSYLTVKVLNAVLKTVYFFKGRKLYRPSHGKKAICIEMTDAKIFGDSNPRTLPIPPWVEPLIQVLRFWTNEGIFTGQALSPHVMPLQLFRIGELGFAALPGEFTTQAGVRMRKMLEPELKTMGVDRFILAGYANGYAGYVTTPEEYQEQNYEGACTHFGLYTLPGYLTLFRQLACEWLNKSLQEDRVEDLGPPEMKSTEYLTKLSIHYYHKKS